MHELPEELKYNDIGNDIDLAFVPPRSNKNQDTISSIDIQRKINQ